MSVSHSFTTKANGLLLVLKSDCHVSQWFNPSEISPNYPLMQCRAIWDTGATGSVITSRVVSSCNLKPISVCNVQGVHGPQQSNVYLINIILPNGVLFHEVVATEGFLPDGDDLLIGMDIISTGDFSVTNKDGLTCFSFRVPSQHHIDYVEEHNRANQIQGGIKKQRNKPPKQFGKNKRRK